MSIPIVLISSSERSSFVQLDANFNATAFTDSSPFSSIFSSTSILKVRSTENLLSLNLEAIVIVGLCERDGFNEWKIVGDEVGRFDGTKVGTSLIKLGMELGDALGEFVGKLDGDKLGLPDGLITGEDDGCNDGDMDGSCDGLTDGCKVGVKVGLMDG